MDNNLIQQIKSGDQQALGRLYEAHRSEFVRWVIKDFRCPEDDSKDIYQMAVLVVYENIQKGKLSDLTSSLKTYLFAVGKNMAREWFRRSQKNEPFDQAEQLRELINEEDDPESDRRLDLVYECLKKIGPPCRPLLEQFYFNRLSMEEITVSLRYKNADTAKNQKYKCMGRLRKYYEEEVSKQLT